MVENFSINKNIFREKIYETDKIIKYAFNISILLGACGFLIVGISSYIGNDIIFFLKSDQIIFFPQGLTMCLYGIAGVIIGINQLRVIILEIGEGYNEFNKDKNTMTIFRKGAKGTESDVNIVYPLTDIVRINNLEILYKILNLLFK